MSEIGLGHYLTLGAVIFTIGIVGKYTSIIDSYKSLIEALNHGGIANKTNVDIKWIDAEELDDEVFQNKLVKDVNGILVPGGFGKRGSVGKMNAIKYARESKIPFFGISNRWLPNPTVAHQNVAQLKETTGVHLFSSI